MIYQHNSYIPLCEIYPTGTIKEHARGLHFQMFWTYLCSGTRNWKKLFIFQVRVLFSDMYDHVCITLYSYWFILLEDFYFGINIAFIHAFWSRCFVYQTHYWRRSMAWGHYAIVSTDQSNSHDYKGPLLIKKIVNWLSKIFSVLNRARKYNFYWIMNDIFIISIRRTCLFKKGIVKITLLKDKLWLCINHHSMKVHWYLITRWLDLVEHL